MADRDLGADRPGCRGFLPSTHHRKRLKEAEDERHRLAAAEQRDRGQSPPARQRGRYVARTTARIHLYSERAAAAARSSQPSSTCACLEALVNVLAARGAHRLVLERDDSRMANDQRIIYARVHKTGCADTLTYVHQRAHEEPLLAIPDTVAWCWTRGGHWRTTIRKIITRVERV